ncbi:hypothetical protein FLAN108750_10720 [Flavobacterium antarcticum]|uniref:hypothetical protein n=1 Tax=Flavobacterium antarcticum TaxID=271155 RepID=UPI0003B7950A|nr:hypothetical protein [Flavobacterium antarcticum]
MKIHLLRSPEFSQETYSNVLQLLQQYRGPLQFVSSGNEDGFSEDFIEEKLWLNKDSFEHKKSVSFSHINMVKESKISFPFKEKTKTWKQLFTECDNYRRLKNIPDGEIVVLLTDIANDKNWFGSVSPSMKNYFIQTSNWEHFFGNGIDIRFPIAYEVIIWVMRYFMFADNDAILKNIHNTPIGCIMDFCKDKSQIILKMRTADVCPTCMTHFVARDVSILLSQQFFDILDGIRKSMTFRGRSVLLHKPSILEIKGRTKKIFFADLGGLELRLNPKEKALFLLFLKYPEGLILNELQDFRNELTASYSTFCNHTENDAINQSISNLINPFEQDRDIVLSRINKKIKDTVGELLMDFYTIKGERGERKKIKLDRELVTYLP